MIFRKNMTHPAVMASEKNEIAFSEMSISFFNISHDYTDPLEPVLGDSNR